MGDKADFSSKVTKFVRRHTILAIIVAALVFIGVVVGASFYGNMLVYDYGASNGQAVGLGAHQSVTKTLVQYDGTHFVAIAKNGYSTPTDYAYLPVYPLLIRGLERISPLSYEWSAILIAWAALVAAVIVLYKWAVFEFSQRQKKISPWLPLGLLAIFPTAMYFALPYTESLFLLFNVGALFAFRKQSYWAATLLAGLASATRYQGIILVVFFLADWFWSQKRDPRKLLPVLGATMGLGSYLLFLQLHTGSWSEFLNAERQWGRLQGNVLANLINSLRPLDLWYLLIIPLSLKSVWQQLGRSYFLYSLAFVLLPLASGRFDAFNRYMLNFAPMFLALAITSVHTPKIVRLTYIVSSAFLAGWSILLFSNGYWVG